jgi:zinc-ribbon family
MLFLFGTGKSELKYKYPLNNCSCPGCGQKGTMFVGTTAHYFHFFFIPIFPTGKKRLAKCMHCNSTIDENSFTPEMRQAFVASSVKNPNKTPIWHGCGCLLIILFILLIIVTSTCTRCMHRNNPPITQDYRKAELEADMFNLDANPLPGTDSIAFQLKNFLDDRLNDKLNKNEFRYFCKINNNRLLVLIEINDIKKIKADERKKIIPLIRQCINRMDGLAEKELYIGVEGRWNMVLSSSPMQRDLEGSYADEEILYPFYDTAKQITMDSLIIKSKKR